MELFKLSEENSKGEDSNICREKNSVPLSKMLRFEREKAIKMSLSNKLIEIDAKTVDRSTRTDRRDNR